MDERSNKPVTILEVRHASRVAAIPDARGPRAIVQAGLVDALSRERPADLTELHAPQGVTGEVAEAFAVASHVAARVRHAVQRGRTALVLSGSCLPAVGSVAGLPEGRRGVIWLDCHADFHTPDTSESGFLDGMALATLTGRCWQGLARAVPGHRPVPEHAVLLVGVREVDPGEASVLDDSPITRLPAEDVRAGALEAIEGLAGRVDSVYVHIDLDVLDPAVGLANAFATPGGLTENELCGFLEAASARFPVRVAGLASYDPRTDASGAVCRAAVRAAEAVAR